MSKSAWEALAPQVEPASTGTKRDYGNMLNDKIRTKKPRKSHWEMPKKLKLKGF